jgi:hypothetical protein
MRAPILVLLLLASGVVAARPVAGPFVELAYHIANPDWTPFSDGEGSALLARLPLSRQTFVFAHHREASVQIGGFGRGQRLDHWSMAGVGRALPLGEGLWASVAASAQTARFAGRREDGWGVHLGLNYRITPRWSVGAEIGMIDLVIKDYPYVIETVLGVSEHLGLVARMRDYADWDYSGFELGLRLSW